jgi:hypothetical protein
VSPELIPRVIRKMRTEITETLTGRTSYYDVRIGEGLDVVNIILAAVRAEIRFIGRGGVFVNFDGEYRNKTRLSKP